MKMLQKINSAVFFSTHFFAAENCLFASRYPQEERNINFKNDEDLIQDTKLDIEYSKEAKRQCEELNIKFFDTSKDFEKTLYNIYKYIKSNQNDEFI